MSNHNYEQDLLDAYWKLIGENENYKLINKKCNAKKFSDLEYIDIGENILWRIEAKSHMSKDAYNAVHKIFGELLKDTGRPSDEGRTVKHGVLLDGRNSENVRKGGEDFFREYFQYIAREKYQKFGSLIPVEKIIIYNNLTNECRSFTWNQFIGVEQND